MSNDINISNVNISIEKMFGIGYFQGSTLILQSKHIKMR